MKLVSRAKPRSRRARRGSAQFGRLQGLPPVRFGREAYVELRRSHWPDRETTVRLTGLVVAISLLMAVILGLADFVFARLIQFIVT